MSGQTIAVGFLLTAVLSTAVGVVFSTHQTRKLFLELHTLREQRDELNMEWGRLQIEQSTLGAHGRIEKLARQQLQMRLPAPGSAVMVQP
jgi:cell division protein FtsL